MLAVREGRGKRHRREVKMQDEALRPRTKLRRLMGGAAVAEDPSVTGRPSPAAARDGVTKGLGTEGTKKGAEDTSYTDKKRERHTEQKRVEDGVKKRGL